MAVTGSEVGLSAGINNMASGFSKICRTCATCTDCLMPIFSGEGLLNNLADKMQRHLPIQVSEWDQLPQQLCRQCASTLLAWHELVKCCSQADAALRTRLQRIQELTAAENVATTSGVSGVSEKIPDEKVEEAVKSAAAPTPLADKPPAAHNAQHRCTYCRAKFTLLDLYHDHLVSVHIDRLFYCDECGQYEDRKDLVVHMSEHAAQYAAKMKKPTQDTKTDSTAVAEPTRPEPVKSSKLPKLEPKSERIPVGSCEADAPQRGECWRAVDTNGTDDTQATREVTLGAAGRAPETALNDVNPSSDSSNAGNSIKPSNTASDVDESVKFENRHAFSDSDSSDGFGQLPESVFEAIEDTKEAPDADGEPQSDKKCDAKAKGHRKRACAVCGKEFTVSSSYFYHVKYVHTERREHACKTCGRGFASRATLAEHASVHTGVRGHRCAHCDKTFRSKAGLYIHVKDIHSAAQEKRFACSQCDKSFRWKQKLMLHNRRHRRERSHVCGECGRGFSARCDLTRHAKTHAPGKPHGCEQCGARFAQRRYLQSHVANKHTPRAR